MQSVFLIGIKNAHSPKWEKWAYASESFLGKYSFIPWEKKGKDILRFTSEEEVRDWWKQNSHRFDSQELEECFAQNAFFIVKRIWPDNKDKSPRMCRIIKPI